MGNRIAFVHRPNSRYARLETMPFALNTARSLADAGWEVDIFLWEQPSEDFKKDWPANARIRYRREPKPSPLYRVRPVVLAMDFIRYRKYRCVLGVSQIGAYVGAIISRASGCPFIYLNDEFPSGCPSTAWTAIERWAVRRADVVVVPDEIRFSHLAQELGIDDTVPYVAIPNTPKIVKPLPEVNWHERLGIPECVKLFLSAGSISDWAQAPELMSSVSYWPKGTALLLHSRTSEGTEKYRQQLSHLDLWDRIYWSHEPLPEDLLHSLVAYCYGNFALYRDMGPNLRLMGMSSGKLMRSIACETPVIASRFDSLSFVTDQRIGVLVKHPSEIPDAVEDLVKNQEAYRARCREFAAGEASFESGWDRLVDKVKQTCRGFDLNQPDSV